MAKAEKPEVVITDTGDVVDVEDLATTAAVVVQQQPVGQVSIYQSTDPADQLAEAQQRAAILVQVVQDQGLARVFGNSTKPHVYVEGWQFLASQFGLIPDIEWSKELTDDKGHPVGWEARAVLRRLSDGAEIAHAEGECRWDEGNWRNRPSYAVRSMAQTRAVSKVCRVALSSVMVMAGFSATPAEEMDGVTKSSGRVRGSTRGTGGSAPPPTQSSVPRSDPKTTDDPHCPACLDNLGILVGVTGPHDKRPFWRCTAKPTDCGGHRTYNGKDYSWSGWHDTWENSVRDFRHQPIIDEPRTAVFGDSGDRENQSSYIVSEIEKMLGLESKVDAEARVKPALVLAIEEGNVDAEAAIGGPPADPITDEELRVVITNMTLTEAEMVIAAAGDLYRE